jgi:hypothetical protein
MPRTANVRRYTPTVPRYSFQRQVVIVYRPLDRRLGAGRGLTSGVAWVTKRTALG